MFVANEISLSDLTKIDDNLFEIKKSSRSDMLVNARVFANATLLEHIVADRSLWQLTNVATLPGIQKYSVAMPDMHEGYGFPIGGVAAMAIDEGGVISPGGIGYDINCGVRLLASDISHHDAKGLIQTLAQQIFRAVPSGVGRGGLIKLSKSDLSRVLHEGATYMLARGIGEPADLEHCESEGKLSNADADIVSEQAKERGKDQLGTLGSGNHFLEIQTVDEIFDEKVAAIFGLKKNYLTAMIHCGSRGLGHQICTDHVRLMQPLSARFGFNLVDRQLASAPFLSSEGQSYFSAMKAAANFAWANRHVIGHKVREAFMQIFGKNTNLRTVYDVAHNIGKIETHLIDGVYKKVIVHRKGATRAFGRNHEDIPKKYRAAGQPVLIPGTMGTASYVLSGDEAAMDASFGSACHGAGRVMSRHAAKMHSKGQLVKDELLAQGIVVCTDSIRGLSEEAPYAYKDVHEVINVVVGARLANKVARLKPIAVIKGD